MVQVLKEEILNRIHESACKEFYEKGYKNATMRDIAKGASIPAGLIYSYHKNKASLFESIVKPVHGFVEHMLKEDDKKEQKSVEDTSLFNELENLLNFFTSSRIPFLILIDKSHGTKFENVKSDIIDMTKEHIKQNLSVKASDEYKEMDDFFYHILGNNFMEGIFEIARHYKNKDWADNMLKLLAKQYFYGVNSF
jgi:AcrR family transcriptional regulator